jgi:predicted alpha/beta hydrolase family esterase
MSRILILCTALLSGCALGPLHPAVTYKTTVITLVNDPLDIRFIQPREINKETVLILFATGDGGWRKLDQEVFDWIGQQGYPVAGFSASRYLKTMSAVSDSTTPPQLAADFERVIALAKETMNLKAPTKVIFVGVSRGASLSCIAAGQPSLQDHVTGVIAIALGKIEEHVLHRQRRDAKAEWVAVETYDYLRQLPDLPYEIIQSTNDKYTTAAEARDLLGADTPLHRLYPIEAPNHTFRGAIPKVLAQVQVSLNHLTARRAAN